MEIDTRMSLEMINLMQDKELEDYTYIYRIISKKEGLDRSVVEANLSLLENQLCLRNIQKGG